MGSGGARCVAIFTLTGSIHCMFRTGTTDYERIASAIRYLETHWRDQPSLADVARHVGLSESHFQRLFTRWAGISPKRFLQQATAQFARSLLRDHRAALPTTLDAGLSNPSRLHQVIGHAGGV